MKISSEYLSASAGSGKTFALSKRFCHLVMSRVAPDEICALTFTRAATREIFAAIVTRLTDDDDALGTVDEGLSREAALSKILEALPRLQISTIDAFSSMIARLFAYDIGLNPDFALYDGGRQSPEAREIVQESVQRALQGDAQHSEEELLDLFNFHYGATAEIDALSERLQEYLETYESVLESHPEGWGNRDALRLEKTNVDRASNIASIVEEVKACFEAGCESGLFTTGPRGTGTKLRKMIQGYHAEINSVRELKKVWAQEKWEELDMLQQSAKTGEISYYKKVSQLPKAMTEGFDAMFSDVLARDVEQTATHTQALHRALVAIKQAKNALTEERGMLSFDALTKTLAQQVGGQLSVRNANAFYIAYRLDNAIRHLMIDEFQDTGVSQWQILSGMAHELAAEEDGTFFYVGDTKQSIYGWRGGDATLFGDPKRLPKIPAGDPLLVSYRSCPTVINLINTLMPLPFNADLKGEGFETWQKPVVDAWRKQWRDHHSAPKRAQQEGFVQMVTVAGTERDANNRLIDNKAIHRREMARLIAERWKQLKSKQLTTAVLASTNSVFQDEEGLLHHLRKAGVPCALEGKLRVSDTPMGSLVVQLLHWMSDPRATLWQAIVLALELDGTAAETQLNTWMACVNEKGFVAWLDTLFGVQTAWAKRLTESDVRTLEAIRQGLEQLDQKRCTDPALARDAVELLQVPSIADKNVLNLMTIHQSKGLTFSVVFTVLAGDVVRTQTEGAVAGEGWVMEGLALQQTYDAVPALKAARETAYTSRMQDVLCALYVAITRAEREQIILAPEKDTKSLKHTAAWLFTSKPPAEEPEPKKASKAAKSGEFMAVIHHAFREGDDASKAKHTVVFEEGNPDWWKTLNDIDASTQPATAEAATSWVREAAEDAVEVELPSEQAKARTVAELLGKGSHRARDFGIDLHERLAQIEWSDRGAWGVPAEVFQRPDEPCIVWRERPFSVQVSNEGRLRYLPGQFDRVHLFPNSKRAIIYDYKTSHAAEVTPAYARQLKDYQKALAIMTGYPIENIEMKLVFTRHQCIMDVTA